MTFEREVLVSVLKLTKKRRAMLEEISENAGTIAQETRNFLQKYAENGYFQFEDDSVFSEKEDRVKLAVHVFELGADLKRVCDLLGWDEFEDISMAAFEAFGFSVKKHFRFECSRRRWEIDLLGTSDPLVLCVDCKHWNKGWSRSSIIKIAELQIQRTKSLMEASVLIRGKMNILEWKEAIFVPIIISLIPGPFKFYRKTPIVPVLQIGNFLEHVFVYINSLKHFSKEFKSSTNL